VGFPIGNAVDRAQMAVIDAFPLAGSTVHYRIRDDLTGVTSATSSLDTGNAWNRQLSTGPHGFLYEVNLLVQLDSSALPDSVPIDQGLLDLARALDITAERIWDATDGYVRLGKVLVTDTVLNYPANQPFGPGVSCGTYAAGVTARITVADVLVQSSIPFDSHTWGGGTPVISHPCTAIYLGRLGQLVVPWGSDTHTGYVAAHEFAHYALGAPDLYPESSTANCVNTAHEISLMHNTGGYTGGKWRLTEFDRNHGRGRAW
jgi:hypothetical protein